MFANKFAFSQSDETTINECVEIIRAMNICRSFAHSIAVCIFVCKLAVYYDIMNTE